MSAEDAAAILPGLRDRSICPGGIRYKSSHTRFAGEYRYPHEDIVVDDYGNKRIGGYDDNIGRSDLSDDAGDMHKLFEKFPKIRLLCSSCEFGKLFNIENICSRPIFVYNCPRCHSRNGLDVSWLIEIIKKEEESPSDYFTCKCANMAIDNSATFKGLAREYQIRAVLANTEDPYDRIGIPTDTLTQILKLEQHCAFLVKKRDLCAFDGKQRKNRCARCKNYTIIRFINPGAETHLHNEIWLVYRKHLNTLRQQCDRLKFQIKEINRAISNGCNKDLELHLVTQKQSLQSKLDSLISLRSYLKMKWNNIEKIEKVVTQCVKEYGKIND